ncbi:MAG: hypothetical protein IKN65_06330 [Clostridia bacterium]|nr:hypothetical protein [Clostridia bacterium]
MVFKQDEDGDKKIEIYVSNNRKAEAISKILPCYISFGNVIVPIIVLPSNDEDEDWIYNFMDAFDGNEIIDDIAQDMGLTRDMNYVIFKKEVAQYYNDNIQSVDGFSSTLYEDIAREIFKDAPAGTFFCTSSRL